MRRAIARLGRALAAATIVGTGGAWAATADEAPAIEVPLDAPYRLPDGSVLIVGDRTMDPILEGLNAMFTKAHPGVRFTMRTHAPPTGIDGIVAGVSAFAPVAHEAWESEIEPLRRQTGRAPLDIRIGRRGHVGPGRANPPGLYVNAVNPLRAIDLADVARVFTTGQAGGDLRYWRQLGLADTGTGALGNHAIHVYGTRNDGRTMTSVRDVHFGGRPVVRHYEPQARDADVLDAVANDRYGIGLVDFVDPASVPKGVRRLALATAGAAPSSGTRDEVRRGAYPLAPYLHLYVKVRPGQAVDPLVREYLRLALSTEGQRLIDGLASRPEGFVSLTPAEADIERAKLD